MNKKFKLLISVALSLSVCISAKGIAETESAGFGSPEAVDNRIAADAEGREQSFKETIAEKGLSMAVDYSMVGLSANEVLEGADDSSGSGMLRFYGSWDLFNQGEADASGLVWKIEHRHAYTDTPVKGFLFNTGTLGLSTPPFSDEEARMTNLYWRQRLNEGNSTIVAGFLDSTDFFDVYALASPWTGFMNFAFSTGVTTVALPGDAAFGVAGGTMLNENLFLIGGLTDMESDPTDPFNGFDTFFNEGRYFKSVELGWTASKNQIYTDNIHISLWHADESEMQGSGEGQGAVFSYSRMSGQWLPFFRAGISEDAGTLTEKSFSTGFGYYGLGGKNNNLGAAINWAEVEGGDDDQYTFELFYLIKPLPYLEITPDIQFVMNPALKPEVDSTTIIGIRARAIW